MKTTEIGAFHAKTHLSALLEKVTQGQVFQITRRGRPVAELRPVPQKVRLLRFGCDKGKVILHRDFDAPIPDFASYTR